MNVGHQTLYNMRLTFPWVKLKVMLKQRKNELQKSLKKLSSSCSHDERSLHLPKELFLQRHLGDNATFFKKE